MLPPVRPNTASRSGGGRTSLPTILALNPGAYLHKFNLFNLYDVRELRNIRIPDLKGTTLVTLHQSVSPHCSPLNAVEDELCVFLLGVLVPGPVTQVVGRELGEEQADVMAGRGQGRVPGGRQHHLYQGVSAAGKLGSVIIKGGCSAPNVNNLF